MRALLLIAFFLLPSSAHAKDELARFLRHFPSLGALDDLKVKKLKQAPIAFLGLEAPGLFKTVEGRLEHQSGERREVAVYRKTFLDKGFDVPKEVQTEVVKKTYLEDGSGQLKLLELDSVFAHDGWFIRRQKIFGDRVEIDVQRKSDAARMRQVVEETGKSDATVELLGKRIVYKKAARGFEGPKVVAYLRELSVGREHYSELYKPSEGLLRRNNVRIDFAAEPTWCALAKKVKVDPRYFTARKVSTLPAILRARIGRGVTASPMSRHR